MYRVSTACTVLVPHPCSVEFAHGRKFLFRFFALHLLLVMSVMGSSRQR